MKVRIKIWLLILKNLPSVISNWAYVPKLEALNYRKLLRDPCYGASPVLASLHFARYGSNEIAVLGLVLPFSVDGRSYEYCEETYGFFFPEAKAAVQAGVYPNCVSHFVLIGYDQIKSGSKPSFLDPDLQALVRHGVEDVEEDVQPLSVTIDGLHYDFVESYFYDAHPEARVAVRAGRYESALQYFVFVTLPLIRQGKAKLYNRDYTPKVLSILQGESKDGRNLCLFAHYDADGLIDPHVVRYLEGLKTMDCEIVFVSGSASESEWMKITHLCSEFILRNSYGRDFGSWYLAIKHCRDRFDRYNHVLCVNDSVYFPMNPVGDLITRIEAQSLDVWGIHESVQRKPGSPEYHVQSFFIGYSTRAVKSGILDDFVKRFEERPVLTKTGQIYAFEYWTAIHAMELGLRTGALCKVEIMFEGYDAYNRTSLSLIAVNPTIHLWRQSLTWYKSPTLKLELLRHPDVFSVDQLAPIIEPSFYDVGLIRRHSARLATGPQPSIIREINVRSLRRIDRSPLTGKGTLCAFIHYDPDGFVRPYVLRILEALEEVGCEFIFVTGSTRNEEFDKLPESCRRIIQKDPACEPARDMGAYWLALQDLSPEDLKYERYLLANDSVFFPVADHKRMFAEMNGQDYDLWGVVESYQTTWHTMSYLWNFSKECFEKTFLPTFVADYRSEYAKWELIRLYEMRYPGLLRSLGYKVGAYVSNEEVGKALVERHQARTPMIPVPEEFVNRRFNVHHDAWDLLITDFNCPALKIELLRDTDRGARALYELKELLPKYTSYDYGLIADKFGDPE